MRYRTHRGERISEIGLGCYALSGAYGQTDPDRFVDVIRHAFDLGITFFDTADTYGSAEEVLGRAVAPFRDQVWIATKVGWGPERRPDCSPEHVRASCEASLRRLDTDVIDLYQIHFDDPETPVDATVGALEGLKTEGKIRHYGVSHLPPDRMAAYMAAGDVFSALVELSAVARSALSNRIPLCEGHDVGVIAFSVTGRGLLTGKIGPGHVFEEGDIRRMDPLFQRERLVSALRIAERFKRLGERTGKTPVQVAIAWVLAQSQVVCALTGTSTLAHLEENVGGSGWTFAPEDLAALEAFLAAEDRQLAAAQIGTLRRLLTEPLEPETAFNDLVYVLEALGEMGLAEETEILPVFLRLMPLREGSGEGVRTELRAIQAELREGYLERLEAA